MGRRNNRKKQSEGFIFPVPLASALGLAAAVALTYLWLCGRCEAIGGQIKILEDRKTELQKRVINEEYKWASMKSPANIERLLRQFNIEMVWPEKGHVVQVRDADRELRLLQVAANVGGYRRENGTRVNE